MLSQAYDVAGGIAGAPPDEIVLALPRTAPKTSSGKIRRSAAKALYEAQKLGAPERPLWRQVLRLWLAGAGRRIQHLIRLLADILYAGWWWTVVAFGSVLSWLAVMSLPRLRWRWAAARGIARTAFLAFGGRLTVAGLDRIPTGGAMLIFNHSSYADVLVLAAILPGEPAFVAKRELASQTFAGPFLRRLGALFVERFDVASSVADIEAIAGIARQGRNLVFFPEGTFTRRAGLSGFYLGAFKVAAEAKLSISPGILRGTRSMLRADQWFPRWTPISIYIGEAISPRGTDFASVLWLRDAVRDVVLAHCGEPDLGTLTKPAPPQAAA